MELALLGIRVNGVAPGPVETAMAKAVHTPEIRADYHDAILLNRYGLEEELAEAIFSLCSDRASYITGQISQSTAASTPPASACRPCVRPAAQRLSFRFVSTPSPSCSDLSDSNAEARRAAIVRRRA